MSLDVRELVLRCRGGDQAAMARLIEEFHAPVFGLCFRMLGHCQDAEDMAQESFVRAWRSMHAYDENREFRPWIMGIAANRCRTLLASRAVRPKTRSEFDDEADAQPETSRTLDLAEEVKLALGRIREDFRRAFLLYHAEGLNYAEIAAALDCPLGTVKTWVYRARRELSEALRSRGLTPAGASENGEEKS